MAEYMTLLGSEQVQSAGNRMASAADQMSRAASSISDSLSQNQRFLDDWLQRLESVLSQPRS